MQDRESGKIIPELHENRVYDHVWALYAHEDQVKWSFPAELSDEKIHDILRLCDGLAQFSMDVLGGERNIAMIYMEPPDPIRDPIPILIISIDRTHYFVIAHPEIIARVIGIQPIPSDLEDLLRGILISNAILMYSKYYNSVLFEDKRTHVDRVFQQALRAVGSFSEEEVFIGEGACSLSVLSLGELILFSYYVRKILSMQQLPLAPGDWLLLCGRFGVPVHFSFNLNLTEKSLLSGLLASIGTFAANVFGGKPNRMIFGESVVRNFYMIYGEEHILAFTHPDLFFVGFIQEKLEQLFSQETWKELEKPLKEFLVRFLTEQHEMELHSLDLLDLFKKRKAISFSEFVTIKSPRVRVRSMFKDTLVILKQDRQLLESLKNHSDWRVLLSLPSLEKHDQIKSILVQHSQGRMPSIVLPNIKNLHFESLLFLAKLLDTTLSYNVLMVPSRTLFQDESARIIEHVDAFVTVFDFQSPVTFLQALNHVEKTWSLSSREIPVLLIGLLPTSLAASIEDEESTITSEKNSGGLGRDELDPEQQILHHLADFENTLPQRLKEMFLFIPLDLTHEKAIGYMLSALAVLKVKKMQRDRYEL